jgi:hypothetical protein
MGKSTTAMAGGGQRASDVSRGRQRTMGRGRAGMARRDRALWGGGGGVARAGAQQRAGSEQWRAGAARRAAGPGRGERRVRGAATRRAASDGSVRLKQREEEGAQRLFKKTYFWWRAGSEQWRVGSTRPNLTGAGAWPARGAPGLSTGGRGRGWRGERWVRRATAR